MSRPSSLRILGQHFNVTYHTDPTKPLIWGEEGSEELKVGEQAMGYTNSVMQEIVARAEPACGFDQARDTLLHEALHAIFALQGLENVYTDAQVEDLICRISPALLDMMKKNPDMVEYLLEDRDVYGIDMLGEPPHRRSEPQDYDPTPHCQYCFKPWGERGSSLLDLCPESPEALARQSDVVAEDYDGS